MHLPVFPFFTVFYLIEIHGVPVVYGRPEERTEVTDILHPLPKYWFYGIDFVKDRLGKFGVKPVFFHCIPCDGNEVNIMTFVHANVIPFVSLHKYLWALVLGVIVSGVCVAFACGYLHARKWVTHSCSSSETKDNNV